MKFEVMVSRSEQKDYFNVWFKKNDTLFAEVLHKSELRQLIGECDNAI